jgi:hypothetical protein
MLGQDEGAIEHGDPGFCRLNAHRTPHVGVWHRVVIQIEADGGRLTDADGDALGSREGIVVNAAA